MGGQVLLFVIDSGVFIKSLLSLSNGNLTSQLNGNKKRHCLGSS
jgi:hypothetical protein